MTTLILALPLVRPTAGTEFSYVMGDDGGGATGGQGSAPLALLPRADALVLVVPPRALSWHLVKLPPMAAGRQRAALEGMLEDRLLDEPASVALALGGQRRPDGSILVAACDKGWLAAALQLFEQSGRPAHRVVPALPPLADPQSDGLTLLATGTQEEAWLAISDRDGVVCVPLSQAPTLLPGTGQELDAATLIAEPAVAEMAERLLQRPASIRSAAEGLLAANQSDWDLAQFDLLISSRGRMARSWASGWAQLVRAPGWRAVRWGLALLAVANIVGLNAWAWHLQTTLANKKVQVRQVLNQTFPTVKTVVDAPLQMERQLALLRQSSGALTAGDMEPMLAAAGSAIPEGSTPAGIDYTTGQLAVKGLRMAPAQAALVPGKLSAQGYVAQLEGERLTLRAGGRP